FVALPSCWQHEQAISEFLADNGPNPISSDPIFPAAMKLVVDSNFQHLDESQRRALVSAMRNRTSLVSGGAGAGKTTTIKAIVQLYEQGGYSAVLCAPTGKAARRLEEIVAGSRASTIHRLLELHPLQGFRRGPKKPGSSVFRCKRRRSGT